jgi:hypothetical protein
LATGSRHGGQVIFHHLAADVVGQSQERRHAVA